MKDRNKKILYCSFCGSSQASVDKLIVGPSAYICNVCIKVCQELIVKEVNEEVGNFIKPINDFVLIPPVDIKCALDKFIIGQNYEKKVFLEKNRKVIVTLN